MALQPHEPEENSSLALGKSISRPLFNLAVATIGAIHRAAAPIPQMGWDMFVHTPKAVRVFLVPFLLIFFLLYPLSYSLAVSLFTLIAFLGASLFMISTTFSLTAVSLRNIFSIFKRGK